MAKVAWTFLVLSFGLSLSLGFFMRDIVAKAFSESTFDAILANANVARENRDSAVAIDLYEQLISRYPEREEGFLGYAAFAEKINDLNLARRLYVQAVDSGPQAHHALLAYTNFLDRQSESDAALEVCQIYVKRNPDDPWARYELGMRLLSKGDAASAKDHFFAASMLPQLRLLALQRLGQAQHADGQLQNAIETWKGVLVEYASLDSKQVLYDIGRAHYERGEIQLAIDSWEQCIYNFPNSLWCALQLATAYDTVGRTNDADCIRALVDTMTPSQPIAKDLARFLKLSGISMDTAKWSPGNKVVIKLFIVYYDNRLEDVQPEIEFMLYGSDATTSSRQLLTNVPGRLNHGPWFRGDCNVQTFVLAVPPDLVPGAYVMDVALKETPTNSVHISSIEILTRTQGAPSS